LHPLEIRERPKLKSSVQGPKKIVLMTRQNVTWLQPVQRGGQSRTRIGQCHSEDSKIHPAATGLARRQLRRCSAGIDVNALAVDFDEKRQRFSANPIGRALRWASTALFMSIKRHLAKKPIMGRGQNANFPWANSPKISRRYRVA
jgi:hypothetical protein